MSSDGRLQPFESLEGDYYLDGNNVWFSDGENRDSDSSDDEVRVQLLKLAGFKSCARNKAEEKRDRAPKKDEFESDMDSELDESFVAHTSNVVFASPAASASSSHEKALSTDDEFPALVSEDNNDDVMGTMETSGSDSSKRSVPKAKRVHFAEPQQSSLKIKSSSDVQLKEAMMERTSRIDKEMAFNDTDNILRKAADKARKSADESVADFYDPEEDDDNEKWVRQHRERLKIIPQRSEEAKNREQKQKETEKTEEANTDAVLSCPACMALLTRDCQRHDIYKNQYRAIFVENCTLVDNELLFMPRTGQAKRKAARKSKQNHRLKPNTLVDNDVAKDIPKEDLFHAVKCSVCSTNVGVCDSEEVYHFFNVLSGYA